MNYLLGLRRLGHPVIVVHTGREAPPDYPEFEVRDARGLFLEEIPGINDELFTRPPEKTGDWDKLPVSVAQKTVSPFENSEGGD